MKLTSSLFQTKHSGVRTQWYSAAHVAAGSFIRQVCLKSNCILLTSVTSRFVPILFIWSDRRFSLFPYNSRKKL